MFAGSTVGITDYQELPTYLPMVKNEGGKLKPKNMYSTLNLLIVWFSSMFLVHLVSFFFGSHSQQTDMDAKM